ncbi:LCP family protein [Streptomyces sp. NPDC001941]|uniref:LCP family glycopolymer transferase n=1 Tax=Streptomyces sp. NPDC001941 TaxID=3154659 RepID=UPI0033292EE9
MNRLAVTASAVLALGLGALGAPSAARPAHDDAPHQAGRGVNVLLVGIDRRTGISPEDKRRLHVGGKECNCTDVMLLAHLSADGQRASVVSLPRDSYVEYGDGSARGKINAAFQRGGAPLTISTVERATGLHVDHYLETDFTGFEQAVDGLGGATICSAKPLQDTNSGLRLRPGVHRVTGNTALRYARARHVSPPGDLGRVRRQQRLLIGMLQRLRAENALADPGAAARTAWTLLRSVRTGPDTGVSDVVSLGLAFGRLDASRTEFATVPLAEFDHRVPGVGSTVLWHAARAGALWDALREDRPVTGDTRIQPPVGVPVERDPRGITARVDDAPTAQALRDIGFVIAPDAAQDPAAPETPSPKTTAQQTTVQKATVQRATTQRHDGPTVITYDPYWERDAAVLAAALPGARLRPVPGHGPVFDIAVGTGHQGVTAVTFDRSAFEGAPVSGEELTCPTPAPQTTPEPTNTEPTALEPTTPDTPAPATADTPHPAAEDVAAGTRPGH